MTGTIQRVMDKGYGFIAIDGSEKSARNLFFHFNSRIDRAWEPQEGQRVEFEMKDGMKGPEAANVKHLADGASAADEDAMMDDESDADLVDQDEDEDMPMAA